MAFMIGLMAGSLYVLWPFKRIAMVGTEKVYLGNTLPSPWGSVETVSLIAAIIGISETNVKVKVHRARVKLRKMLNRGEK